MKALLNLRKISLFLTFLTLSSLVGAQVCDCEKELGFLINTYQQDYAGFQDFKAVHPNYEQKFEKILRQATKANEVLACHKVIESLMDYLNNGHVYFGAYEDNPKYDELSQAEGTEEEADYYPSMAAPNAQTLVLKIKTGDLSYKEDLDALLEKYKNQLDTIPHLVIDLRGNTGGGDGMYNEVLPLIYTDPILSYMPALWASENNVQLFKSFLENPQLDQQTKDFLKPVIEKAEANPNTFVLLGENKVDTILMEQVKTYPQKVSIVVDKDCASATEEFLLAAKQSAKTTIYGYENTAGVLDYANLNVVFTPSNYWYATVPTTRTTRLPEQPVDPNGIAPDVLVDKSVTDIVEWVINR